MRQVTIKCRACGGTGRKVLTGVKADTLRFLGRRKETSAAELARAMGGGVSGEAMANRLAALEREGLVTCREYGRAKLYRVTRA
jgi:DNA-binding transcriptional ArsR family regulator